MAVLLNDRIVQLTGHNVFVASQDRYLHAFARSDGWFAWKADMGSGANEYPIEPVWSDDPLELTFKMEAPSGWLMRMQIRRSVQRPTPKKKARPKRPKQKSRDPIQ